MGITNNLPSSRIAQAGVIPNTAARPASPYEGQMLFQLDTKQLLIWDGTAWVMAVDTDTPPGLELVKTQTVGTGVSSVTVTGVFSSGFENYKITYNGGSGNTFQDISMVLGSTTSGYYWVDTSTSYVNGAVVGLGSNTTSNAYWRVGKNTTDGSVMNMDILNPFLNKKTFYSSINAWSNTGAGFVVNGGYLNNDTSYTDFTLNPIGSTLTGGTIRVYGYRNQK